MRRIEVIDSHTEGEPTRVIVGGVPDVYGEALGPADAARLGSGAMEPREALGRVRAVLRQRFDWIRSSVVNEPRGSEVMVGALVLPPAGPRAVCGVIFFNNVGYLSGCGHGTIGLAATLRHLGRVSGGEFAVETPAGEVAVTLLEDGSVSLRNVASRRSAAGVEVSVPWRGSRAPVRGSVAWGGNWFFLVDGPTPAGPVRFGNVAALTEFASATMAALAAAGVRGDDGGEIDHVELFGAPTRPDCRSKNFVLCPGGQYDRSPCGTGTSAKVACLAAEGALAPGEAYGQESIVGSRFVASYERVGGEVVPTIAGRAWITAESTLVLDERDPFVHGIRAEGG